MTLSRGAQRCLDVLRWYAVRFRDVYPYQETIGKKLGKTDRQVRRYLVELREAGLVEVKKEGQNPATYRVSQGQLQDVENTPGRTKNVRSASGQMSGQRPVCAPASITELSCLNQEQASSLARNEELPQLPPVYIENEFGRRMVNPERQRIEGILRNARGRIERANNPKAYERAILQRELAASRRQGHVAQRDPAKPGLGHETPHLPLAEEPPAAPDPPRKPPEQDREWRDGFLSQVNALAVGKSFGRGRAPS